MPQSHCLVQVAQTGTPCSLYQTIQALQGAPQTSYVFRPTGPNQQDQTCTMLLDWPNVDMPFRDGTPYPGVWLGASDQEAKKCHVLDRFLPFRYQYQPGSSMPPGDRNSIQAGACQTARVATLNPQGVSSVSAGRCVRASIGQSKVTLTCDDTTTKPTLARKQPLDTAQTWTVFQKQARRYCARCTQPPRFTTAAGASMPAESSFGRPFRVSAERMLAKDLRDALCNSTSGCPAFNRSAWVQGEFMRNYLLHPDRLFLTPLQPAQPSATTTQGDDSAHWANPWVYCPSTTALKTSQGCTGTISRDQWLANRVDICPSMLKSLGTQGGQDPMATTPFCNIHSSTTELCQAVEQAKLLVQQANCIASGQDPSCLPSPFVYHPASFDTTYVISPRNPLRCACGSLA